MKRLKRLVYNSLLILTAICSLSISVFAVVPICTRFIHSGALFCSPAPRIRG